MTNNQLTKEWLQNRIADMESTRDDIPFGFDESGNNELAAFKLALAAMDSEPDCKERKLFCSTDTARMRKAITVSAGTDVAQLYRHAQPAPVSYSDFEEFWSAYIHPLAQDDELKDFSWGIWNACVSNSQPAPVVPDGYVMVPEEPTESMVIAGFESEPDEFFSESEVWEAYQKMSGCEQAAFRARLCWRAMLAAAPQEDINALIPLVSRNGQGGDRWIPVSERMPEDRTQVILWDAEIGEVTSGHYSHKTQTFYHCGDAIENEITHWMLPPSAPQGVKP
ncbi:hypothetical protein BME39_14135 [Klebsiella quasipneumoniae subsp. similipneumoniae]|nr:DUF551 domain-containing protein [Klebsiella quasipneumoniae]OVX17679.1 hypothetical protein BME39_14135 [Klebsiella quasipneumoniae subsp. similipneumoniae]